MYRKNTAGQFIAVQGVDSSTGGIKSGVSWTVRRCIDGTFAAATGTATEDSTNGWYKFAMSQADTNGNNIQFNFTGTGAVPQTVNIITTAADPTDSVRFGLTALPNAAAEAAGGLYTRGTGAGQIKQTNNGEIDSNATHINNIATTSVTTVGANIGTTQPINFTGTSTTAYVKTDVIDFGGTAVTGRDIGASVLLSSGTGTGQIKIASGYVAPNWGDVGNPTTAVGLTGTTISTSQVVASVTGAVGSVTGAVGSVTAGVTVTTNNDKTGYTVSTVSDKTGYSLSSAGIGAIYTTQLTEAYAAQGVVPTGAQILFEMRALQAEKAVASTTLTTHKIDGSTTAATYTLSDAVNPVSITRAT